jgi:hypothetical protein
MNSVFLVNVVEIIREWTGNDFSTQEEPIVLEQAIFAPY